MHTEAVNTCIFDVTPVSEDTQLHKSINLVTGVLREKVRGKERRETKRKAVKERSI